MKKTFTIFLVLILSLSFIAAVSAADDFGAAGAKSNQEPTFEEMLTYAIQDEYLAHAEYQVIMGEYGTVRPFSNISRAEETHISWLIPLFAKYGFALPEDTAAEHAVLPKDMKTALEIGVQAEIDNIAMYESFLKQDLPQDVRDVFENLKNGSVNHLRAFRNNLGRY
jgi:hypothetical protein